MKLKANKPSTLTFSGQKTHEDGKLPKVIPIHEKPDRPTTNCYQQHYPTLNNAKNHHKTAKKLVLQWLDELLQGYDTITYKKTQLGCKQAK